MKFTKEEAVEKLNQTLTNGGKKPLRMSKRTLEGQAEHLMTLLADDDTELDSFVEKVRPFLEITNSNVEHDVSEGIKAFKDKPEQNPEPKPQTTKVEPGKDENPLLARLEALEKELADNKRRTSIQEKRNGIVQYLSDNNVKDKVWIDKMMEIASIGEDTEIEEKGKQFLELYNKDKSGSDGRNPLPSTQPSEGDAHNMFSDISAERKKKAESLVM